MNTCKFFGFSTSLAESKKKEEEQKMLVSMPKYEKIKEIAKDDDDSSLQFHAKHFAACSNG